MWLKRLPPGYQRRYYTNLAVIVGFLVFIFVVPQLGQQAGTRAILGLITFLLLFMCVWPLVQLLRASPRPDRTAFIFYAGWILAYLYVVLGFFIRGLPGVGLALLLGLGGMWAFFFVYRRVVFPSLFDGGFKTRWQMIREAQRADRTDQYRG